MNDDQIFVNMKTLVEKIRKVYSKYRYEDLLKAVYCLCVDRKNSCILEECLSLNKTLLIMEYEEFGKETIDSYHKFKIFFDEIASLFPESVYTDYIIGDFGEAVIKYKNSKFPVILGNGYENNYPRLLFIEELSNILKQNEMTEVAFNYQKKIIKTVKQNHSKEYNKIFVLPSYNLFISVYNNYDKLLTNQEKEMLKIMDIDKGSNVHNRNFIEKNGNVSPIYNSAFLVDLYAYLLSKSTDEKINTHIERTIFKIANNNYNIFNKNKSLLSPIILKDGDKTKKPYSFLWIEDKFGLIAINSSNYENVDLEISFLKELHKENKLSLVECIKREEGNIGCFIPNEIELYFIVYDIESNPYNYGSILKEKEQENVLTLSPIDTVFILNFMKDFSELAEFIKYKDHNNSQIISHGGESDLFCAWKGQNKMIEKGAAKIGMIVMEPGMTDSYILEYFEKNEKQYPIHTTDDMFSNPFVWNIDVDNSNENYGFIALTNKAIRGFFGYGKNLKKGFLFLNTYIHYFNTENINYEFREKLRFLDELNTSLFSNYANYIDFFEKDFILQITYMPMSYAREVDNNGFTYDYNRKYVYSDINITENRAIIRYTINFDLLLEDIENSTTKKIETDYLKELLLPLADISKRKYEKLVRKLNQDSKSKKIVSVAKNVIEYFYNLESLNFDVDNKYFLLARKKIAEICSEQNIIPDEYIKVKDIEKLELLRDKLLAHICNELSKYSKNSIIIKLIDSMASCQFIINLNRSRANRFENLDKKTINKIQNDTNNYREEYRRHIRDLQYLEEIVLCHNVFSKNDIYDESYLEIVAFTSWILTLQDCINMWKLNDKTIKVKIQSDYLVDTIVSKKKEKSLNDIKDRIYRSNDYELKYDEVDMDFLEKVTLAFEEDTGINFRNLIDVLSYLKGFVGEEHLISQNTFRINKDKLVNLIYEELKKEFEAVEIDSISQTVEFCIIDPKKIKEENGVVQKIVPIWNREQRSNRADVKPLILDGDDIIYAPIICDFVLKRWQDGFLNFFAPYEIGLNNTIKTLKSWKKRYEDQIVVDIIELFESIGVKNNFYDVYLNEIDKKGCHPKNLGDYDVLAIDTEKKIIWYCECKFLSKVGSIFESVNEQKNFFFDHKFDEVFVNRVNYLSTTKNYKSILKEIGLEVNDYEIKSFLVTNKVFASRYKELSFTIMSFYEFKIMLDDIYNI